MSAFLIAVLNLFGGVIAKEITPAHKPYTMPERAKVKEPSLSDAYCGMTTDDLLEIEGYYEDKYDCANHQAIQYNGTLFVFYKDSLAGTAPLPNWYEECMDARLFSGFKSICGKKHAGL